VTEHSRIHKALDFGALIRHSSEGVVPRAAGRPNAMPLYQTNVATCTLVKEAFPKKFPIMRSD